MNEWAGKWRQVALDLLLPLGLLLALGVVISVDTVKKVPIDIVFILDEGAGLAIAGDGHPTGAAHQIVAQHIVADLGIGKTDIE